MLKVGVTKFPKRGEIYWVTLDPTVGAEIKKTRPALIVSNDAANEKSRRIVVAPITSTVTNVFPFEVKINLRGKDCKILLDQVRSIDKSRLKEQISTIDRQHLLYVERALKVVFALV